MLAATLLAASLALADCMDLATAGAARASGCFEAVATQSPDGLERARALRYLGDVDGANAEFRRAVDQRPDDPEALVQWAGLYRDVHQVADAEALLQQALALNDDHVGALLGLAELALGRFESDVRRYLDRVLAAEPDQPDAQLMLARLALESAETQVARDRLQALLAAGVELRIELDAYALLAAADAVDAVAPSLWVERALARNPRFGAIHAEPARLLVINRRYREAVERFEQALAVAPADWDAHAELGMNLLRVDRQEDARRHLQTAYQGDPYNALTVNSLRLLDLLDDYADLEDDAVRLRAPADQASVLQPYVTALAARARSDMARRYGYRPEGPVVVELYRHHDDFAVRTAGLPGLGILGATFGDVLVMDGPAAKTMADGFDWASALWHELAHVYTLGATDNRVARWFSEGVSVMEEWRHGPSPRKAVPLAFIEALAEDRLLAVEQLDEGFLRPRYPQQIAISYIQAGLLCELIDERYPGGLARILQGYRRGDDSAMALREGLGISAGALDEAFRQALAERFGELAAQLDDYREQLDRARQAAAQGRWEAARSAGADAVGRYPGHVDPDSAYLPLARALDALQDLDALTLLLTAYLERGGRDPWALARLAALHGQAGRLPREIEVLEVLARTTPLDGELHGKRGDRLMLAQRPAEALAEYQAAMQLAPHDQARARLRLARAFHALDRIDEARRAVLQALEIAPRYGPALDLLVALGSARDAAGSDTGDPSHGALENATGGPRAAAEQGGR